MNLSSNGLSQTKGRTTMRKLFVRALVLGYFWVWSLPPAGAQGTKSCVVGPVAGQKVCSYAALNGDCTITIDRLNPITPPTIYASPSAKITVAVINPSAYENLTLDWKSTTAAVPPDTFSTVLSALTGNLGKITVSRV